MTSLRLIEKKYFPRKRMVKQRPGKVKDVGESDL